MTSLSRKNHLNIDNLTKFSLIVAILIIALSVAYYFVVFIPQKEKQLFELQKQSLEQKTMEDTTEQDKYDACLSEAKEAEHKAWLNRCKANNIKIEKDDDGNDNCKLQDYMSQSVKDDYEKSKETCLKLYLTK